MILKYKIFEKKNKKYKPTDINGNIIPLEDIPIGVRSLKAYPRPFQVKIIKEYIFDFCCSLEDFISYDDDYDGEKIQIILGFDVGFDGSGGVDKNIKILKNFLDTFYEKFKIKDETVIIVIHKSKFIELSERIENAIESKRYNL